MGGYNITGKNVRDELRQTQDDGDGSTFDPATMNNKTLKDGLDAVTAISHAHANKAILDGITDAGSGEIITDDERSKLGAMVLVDVTFESFTLTPTNITNKFVQLSQTPKATSDVMLILESAPGQIYGYSYSLQPDGKVTWNGYDLDGVLQSGDRIEVLYTTEVVSQLPVVFELFVITSLDITNKYVQLSQIPTNLMDVLMHIRGAPGQTVGTSYNVQPDGKVDWNGLGLDGRLIVGDVMRVFYR